MRILVLYPVACNLSYLIAGLWGERDVEVIVAVEGRRLSVAFLEEFYEVRRIGKGTFVTYLRYRFGR